MSRPITGRKRRSGTIDGSLLLTIDNTIDGAGHTASAKRTVLLGFDKSSKAKILKSTVKYESKNDDKIDAW